MPVHVIEYYETVYNRRFVKFIEVLEGEENTQTSTEFTMELSNRTNYDEIVKVVADKVGHDPKSIGLYTK